MEAASNVTPSKGPAFGAVDPWVPGNPSAHRLHQLLSEEERAQLATLASIVRFKKSEQIYAAGEPAETIFNIISGVVATAKTGADGSQHIIAFLHPQDLFGLSEEGRYENTAKAITPVTAYAMPVSILRRHLPENAALEFHVIVKLCHELREVQRHALLLAQKHALARLAMFLQLQERLQASRGEPVAEIYLPMSRADIAKYIGISQAAVSRGFRSLAARRIIGRRDRRHMKIVNRAAFERLAGRADG